ncbi:MAG: 50S ribosomal protein L31 [Planctomycetes bacterium]|nr:50S ribosomal protein L31 [Planctomycetota bacterium]
MKGVIHPKYAVCKVRCACGHEFETVSLREEMRVDICSNCHPFYTGKQKFVDTAGRVQKFEKRFNWSDMEAMEKAKKKTAAQKKKKKIQKIGKVKLITDEAAVSDTKKTINIVKKDVAKGEKKPE